MEFKTIDHGFEVPKMVLSDKFTGYINTLGMERRYGNEKEFYSVLKAILGNYDTRIDVLGPNNIDA